MVSFQINKILSLTFFKIIISLETNISKHSFVLEKVQIEPSLKLHEARNKNFSCTFSSHILIYFKFYIYNYYLLKIHPSMYLKVFRPTGRSFFFKQISVFPASRIKKKNNVTSKPSRINQNVYI